jgi:hypothetical protein
MKKNESLLSDYDDDDDDDDDVIRSLICFVFVNLADQSKEDVMQHT